MPLYYRQHADARFESRQLKSRLLSRKKELWSNPGRKSYGVDVKCTGQFRQDGLRLLSKESKTICKQRSKTKLSVTSLKKKSSMHKRLPSENAAKRVCHYSTCQNVKFNSGGINKQLHAPQGDAVINGARKIVNRRSSFIASRVKHPRSYAEMIADYSESLYKESVRNDGPNNAMRRSPFSTFSASPPAKKLANVAEYSELATERNDSPLPVKSFDLCDRRGNVNTVERYDFQRRDGRAAEAISKSIDRSCVADANDLRSDDQSYAKLITDCSKSMHDITSALNDGPVPKRNVLARSSLESIITPRRDGDTQTKLREMIPAVSAMPFEESVKERATDSKGSDWLREMENVMNDLRSATERKVARAVPKMKESDVSASGDLSGGINGFAEPGSSERKENDAAIKRLGYRSNRIDRVDERKRDFEMQRHNYSHSSNKASRPPQRFVRENSTRVSAGGVDALRQPQVKLRMVPSERESVVSIDVDPTPVGPLDPANSIPKHLSVVVQSDRRKEDRQLNDRRNAPTLRRAAESALQRTDFGPMRISISEDSAPVKQIEFSINGKPVSELKSITARAERLDVVSSADKIEIRIPFAEDDASARPEDKAREGDLSRGTNSNVGQILNVQISANFRDGSAGGSSAEKAIRNQHGEDRIPQSSPAIPKIPYLSNNFSKTYEETLRSNNVQQYGSSKRADVKFNDEKNRSRHKIPDDFEIQRKATKTSSNVEAGRLSMRKANTTGFPEANKYNEDESPDDRVPSKMIPWWSSSDSFNKIRKKDDDHKPLVPPSNRNDHKTVSNLNKDFIAESLLSKPKEMSDSKELTKKTQPMNNSAVTSDSSNTISYSNSMKPYEGSESIPHYAYSFRLKSNQGNLGIIPDIVSNGLKAKNNQTLTANKDINKISEVKQTKSHTLFESDKMNIKGKRDTRIKEKTFVLEGKIKTPNSAQNLSPKKNEEKKDNYLLKQTRSIDDVSKNIKSRIKNILDAIKPIEKSRDGISVDFGLKGEIPSRKPIVISNSGLKEVRNPSPVITAKDLISKSSTAETGSNKIDKNILTKQIETKEILKTNIDVLLKKGDLKTDTTVNIKTLNNSDVKNTKKVYKNEFMSANSLNFSNSPELMRTLKKQSNDIGFQDKSKQNLKSLLEADKSGSNSLLNTRTSGTVQRFQKLGVSGKVSLKESKQNKTKNLTNVKNAPGIIQEIEKLKGSTSSKLANPLKESLDTIMINKSPLQTVKQIQSKNTNKIADINKLSSSPTISNLTSKIKDRAGTKNLKDKNVSDTSITQSVKTGKTDVGDIIARIVTQNPKNKVPLSKDCEKNFSKPGSSKGNLLGSAGPSRKPSNSVGFKSAGSKINSRVMSNNNCAYDRRLLMESFHSNFHRKNDIVSNSQSAIFKDQQSLSDVNMLKHPAPTAIGCNGSWISMDRPEKSLLYSAWLQRSDNDVKKNGKLF